MRAEVETLGRKRGGGGSTRPAQNSIGTRTNRNDKKKMGTSDEALRESIKAAGMAARDSAFPIFPMAQRAESPKAPLASG